MKELVCQTTQVEQVPPLWWQTVCANYSRVLPSPDSVSEKITEEEQSPLIRRQDVRRNYSEQMTEKQNSVKTCTKSPKRETPPIYGNRCSFNQKRKSCPYKAGMKRLKSYKSSNLLLWKLILEKSSTAATNVPNRWWNFSTIPAYDQISVLNLCRNWKTFTFTGSDVQLQ